MVVTVRNLVHAALWLVATLFGVAVVYALLNAGFIGSGAGCGLYRRDCHSLHLCGHADPPSGGDTGASVNKNWWAGALVAVATFAGLVFLLQSWSGFSKTGISHPVRV